MFNNGIAKIMVALVLSMAVALPIALPVAPLQIPCDSAVAAIKVGENDIQGYEPKDVVSTDKTYSVSAEEAAPKLEATVIKIIKILMPLLMIACVGIIVYNAARNIFKKPEDRVKMGDLVKNMFINFFFILFAWIIVEGIVFIVTNGEMILFSTIVG